MASESKEELPPSISIKNVKFVCVSAYKVREEENKCNICLNKISECCIDCSLSIIDKDTVNCCAVSGEFCSHIFHSHCINKFFRANTHEEPKCPLCKEKMGNLQVVSSKRD
jgi:hypothetical protein